MQHNGAAKFSGDLRERILANRYDAFAKSETSKLHVCQPLNLAVVGGSWFYYIFFKSKSFLEKIN
jgi:hypothetical protein